MTSPPDSLLATAPAQRQALDVAAKRARQEERFRSDLLPLHEAAVKTGASERRLLRLVRRGKALATEVEGEVRIPAWQLRFNEIAPVVPEAHSLAECFADDLVALHDWLERTHHSLGKPPSELLGRGEGDRVLRLAEAIGAAGR